MAFSIYLWFTRISSIDYRIKMIKSGVSKGAVIYRAMMGA